MTLHICGYSGDVYKRKLAPARVPYWDDYLISYRVYMMPTLFSYHVGMKTHLTLLSACHFGLTKFNHALPVPVHPEVKFIPKWVVVPRLHDTGAGSRTGMKFSLRHRNRDELAPVWLFPVWHFLVVPCKQMQSHKREPEWTRYWTKVAPVSCELPLSSSKIWRIARYYCFRDKEIIMYKC